MFCTLSLLVVLSIAIVDSQLFGQQIHVAGPSSSASSSFHENFGVNFGFSLGSGGAGPGSRLVGLLPNGQTIPNVTFSQNNSVTPAFGGFDPNSGARFGFARRSQNGGGFSLGFNFSQGSSRTINSVTPSLTIPNGGFGVLTHGSFRPFVTGVVPVVGVDNAVTRAIASGQLHSDRRTGSETQSRNRVAKTPRHPASSATVGDASVASIEAEKMANARQREREYELAIQSAKEAESNKDFVNVRRNIRRALKLTDDPKKIQLLRLWMKEYRGKY